MISFSTNLMTSFENHGHVSTNKVFRNEKKCCEYDEKVSNASFKIVKVS